jgi:hypothetical protein
MTYLEIIERAKRICNQPTEVDSGLWLDSLWLSILNNIHVDLVDKTKAISTKEETATVVSQEFIEVPVGIVTPTLVYLDGNLLEYKNPKTLGMLESGWVEADAGKPRFYYALNGKVYFDRPAAEVYNVVIFGTKRVTDMSAEQLTPFEGLSNLAIYSKTLLFGLVVEFCSDTDDYEKGDVYATKFERMKRDMVERVHAGIEDEGLYFQPTPIIYSDEV